VKKFVPAIVVSVLGDFVSIYCWVRRRILNVLIEEWGALYGDPFISGWKVTHINGVPYTSSGPMIESLLCPCKFVVKVTPSVSRRTMVDCTGLMKVAV
jgi:hypothetical protein